MGFAMQMRFVLFVFVLVFLAMAYSEFFWRIHFLRKIFKFLYFDGPRASASEQTAHYLGGTMAYAIFNLLGYLFFGTLSFFGHHWFVYLFCAFLGWVIKEYLEFLWTEYVSKTFRYWGDSLADLLFWLLGGLTAPLLKMFL